MSNLPSTVKELFRKDITRPINGVVKADQTDDAAAWEELEEYVVTRELATHFRKFFDAYLKVIDRPHDTDVTGATGAWISGFFGSGKSHFLKILSYLLENRAVEHNGTTKRALEFFEGKFEDSLLFGDVKRAVNLSAQSADVLLFNIDSKANPGDGRAAILNVFLRVFNERAGYSGDHPHIAAIERHLDEQGQLAAFHEAFHVECGNDWSYERDAYSFVQDQFVAALSRVLGQSAESCRLMIEQSAERFPLTPENFAKWVREYLDRRGPGHRILFLVDEIGQFIGADTHLMLSLQTITENLGTACEGRAWVIVTSQENIDAVLGEVRASKANDFSKIQGRFRTRLSLSSSNTDEVIQRRLLEKTSEAQTLLTSLFTQKGDVLRNQTRFQDVGETFQKLEGAESFALNYPFLPYQFGLLQRILEEIRRHGATGLHLSRGERSMLEAFKSAAEAIAHQSPGVLVPLYRFYPSIASFLDTAVARTINQASERGLEEFDVNLLKTLFLIRYVDKFKGNLENLATLCVDEIDIDRIALRARLTKSLERLETETLIGRNGEDFFFLTNEERDISREIKDFDIAQAEETKKLGELIFDGVFKGQTKYRYPDNKKEFGFNRFLDGAPLGSRMEANELAVKLISPLNDEFELYDAARCILESTHDHCLLFKMGPSDKLRAELRVFLQTDKYVQRKSGSGLPELTERILRERAAENHGRERRLVELVRTLIEESDVYADGQSRAPGASGAEMRLAESLDYLIKNSFPKLVLLSNLKANPLAEIQATLRANDIAQLALDIAKPEANSAAIGEVRDHIARLHRNNQPLILAELVERFEKRPYGWPDQETALIVARLARVGEISLIVDGAIVPADRAGDPLTKPSRWRNVILQQRKTVDSTALRNARTLGNELFAQMGPENESQLSELLRDRLTKWLGNLGNYQSLAENAGYPGETESKAGIALLKPLLAKNDSAAFIEEFLRLKTKLLDVRDDYHELEQFHAAQKPVWERLSAALQEFAPNKNDLNRDATAASTLQQLESIRHNARPYSQIRLVDGLISGVRAVNDAIVAKARESALESLQGALKQVESELDAAAIDATARGPYLEALRSLELQIGAEKTLGNLFLAQNRARDARDAALNRLEIALIPPAGATDSTEPNPAPAPRPRRVIEPKNLVVKTYLESEDEVRQFLQTLESELLAAVGKGERVEIR